VVSPPDPRLDLQKYTRPNKTRPNRLVKLVMGVVSALVLITFMVIVASHGERDEPTGALFVPAEKGRPPAGLDCDSACTTRKLFVARMNAKRGDADVRVEGDGDPLSFQTDHYDTRDERELFMATILSVKGEEQVFCDAGFAYLQVKGSQLIGDAVSMPLNCKPGKPSKRTKH
jgi:hypothetical protein